MNFEDAANRIADALKEHPDRLNRVLDILTEVERPKYEYQETLHMSVVKNLGMDGWRLVCTAPVSQTYMFFLERRIQ